MTYYFDESGSFRIPDNRMHAVGIVVGLAIPDDCEQAFFARFEAFVKDLPRSAFKGKEPKGNLLSTDDRRRFAEMIADFDDVLVCPGMADLTSVAGEGIQRRDRFAKKLRDTSEMCIHETMREEMGLLARQAGNLSPEQFSRLANNQEPKSRCRGR